MKKSILLLMAGAMVLAGCEKNNGGNGNEPVDPNAPKIELEVSGNLTVPPEGGEQSISYTITNAVDGGQVSAKSSETWLGEINCDTEGTVTFVAEANESGADRSAIVTLTYGYGDGQTVDAQFNAIQAAWDKPLTFELTVTPDVSTAEFTVVPSDNDEYYMIAFIDDSFYEAGMDDVAIMEDLLSRGNIQAIQGEYSNTVAGLSPATTYYLVAFGIDPEANTYTSDMAKKEFMTKEAQMTGLTFEFDLQPKTTSVVMDIFPSDKSADYFVTVIDNSWYEAGYEDEDIMSEILAQYVAYGVLAQYALRGDVPDYEVGGMTPGTEYYAVAFGVDVAAGIYNSEMTKETFTTTESQPTDAYATASMDNYWAIEDLATYNAGYGSLLEDPSNPVLAAVDFEYTNGAESCVYILWIGDVTSSDQTELYDATLAQGDQTFEGDPAPLFYVAFDSEPTTLCVIGVDADGNYGDMFMEVVTFTESGKSTNYALFDEYYADLTGGGYAPAFAPRANYVEREVSTLLSAKDFAGKASPVYSK